MTRREAPQLASIKGGTGLGHPLEGTQPKTGSTTVHSTQTPVTPLVQVYTLPQKVHGGASAGREAHGAVIGHLTTM